MGCGRMSESGNEPRRYRTIVADPPWAIEWNARAGAKSDGRPGSRGGAYGLPYAAMSVDAIAALPVADWVELDAHLWLWTTMTFLYDAPQVVKAWGFRVSYTLTWAKAGLGVGQRFRPNTEFVLFCERGAKLPLTRRDLGTHFAWPRGEHSAKPDAFYDLVEQVSPGPYVELFARRARFGWDYWGDQSLGTAELPEAAA